MDRVEFMPINNKTLKADVVAYAKRLEKALNAYREGYYDGEEQWFAVAPFGWGWWDTDVCFVEATTPREAIEFAQEQYDKGWWAPECWDTFAAPDSPFDGVMIVYNIIDLGNYERTMTLVKGEWEPTGKTDNNGPASSS